MLFFVLHTLLNIAKLDTAIGILLMRKMSLCQLRM